MKKKFNLFFWILFLITVPICFFYFLACLNPWIDARMFWPVSMLGLLFPYLAAAMMIIFLIWLIYKWKYSLLILIILLIGWKPITVSYAFHFKNNEFNQDRNITIVSYNVRNLNTTYDSSVHQAFQNAINEVVPQIVCMQEFEESPNKYWPNYQSIQHFSKNLKMPYFYFSNDYIHNGGNYHDGSIIFSKLPLFNIKKSKFNQPSSVQSIISADFVFNNDTIRLFTTRLHPFYLDRTKVNKRTKEENVVVNKSLFYKLKNAFQVRALHAKKLAALIHQSPYPVIVCGDFNSTPVSYTYFKIKGNLQDAFLAAGANGFGTSYPGLSPNLRIDYILADKKLHVDEFGVIHRLVSDHYPIYARLSLLQK